MGIASRRKSEEYIRKGYVKVNGSVITDPAFKVDEAGDTIEFLPELQKAVSSYRYILFNKPPGITATFAEDEGKNLLDVLGDIVKGMAYAGRLDKESEGIMILSDDGEFIYSIMSPENEKEKEYLVETEENVHFGALQKMAAGLNIKGRETRPAVVKKTGPRSFMIVITEGKNRQVRNMSSKVGLTVSKLTRVRIGDVKIGNLEPGQWRYLTEDEINGLKDVGGKV